MNQSLLSLSLLLTLTARLALAQEVAPTEVPELRQNHFSTAPHSIFSLAANVEYERVVTSHLSLYVGVEGSYLVRGVEGWLGARFYPRQSLDGLFIDAHAMVTFANFNGAYRALGGGGLVGYAWQFKNGFMLSAGGGLDVVGFQKDSGGSSPSCFNGVCVLAAAFDGGFWRDAPRIYVNGARLVPSIRFTIGYAL